MTRYEAAEAADKLRRLAALREHECWRPDAVPLSDLPTARALQELAEWIEEKLLPQEHDIEANR